MVIFTIYGPYFDYFLLQRTTHCHCGFISALYRDQTKKLGGIVLIWDGKAYGWRDLLRDAYTERPGAIAVDTDGRLYQAEGGDYQEGAKAWVVINKDKINFVIDR